jgi:hypothetical protein
MSCIPPTIQTFLALKQRFDAMPQKFFDPSASILFNSNLRSSRRETCTDYSGYEN